MVSEKHTVLILVLMEDALVLNILSSNQNTELLVLILVLMEDALVPPMKITLVFLLK